MCCSSISEVTGASVTKKKNVMLEGEKDKEMGDERGHSCRKCRASSLQHPNSCI